MPDTSPYGGNTRRRTERDNSDLSPIPHNGNWGVVFERLDANDRAIDAVTQQVAQIASQVSSLAATTQVLANTDGTFKQQVDNQATQITSMQNQLLGIFQQLGEIKASIKQTITDALKETQGVERRASASNAENANKVEGWLVTGLVGIMGAVLSYLFTHPIH